MTRRHWIALGVAASGCGVSCRKNAVAGGGGALAPSTASVWHSLSDATQWREVMGGPLSEPEPGVLRLQFGESLSAIKWTGTPLQTTFEIELEARRIDGTDFFCGLTFPARPSGECVTWIVGGWGGGLVGISSIDERDASENETARPMAFEKGRWYKLRLACADERIQAWIDGVQVVDLDTKGKKLSLRPGPIDCCAPFGLATWQSTGEFKRLRWRGVCG